MKISEYAVRNYQFTLTMFLMAMALGVVTLFTMPRSEDPELTAPFYTIVVVYPGATPRDLEQLVVDPLEDRIHELEDIKRIRASISDGLSVIRVEYKYTSNIDEKYQELIREVNALQSSLPPGIASMEVQKFQASDVNVFQIALVSENASRAALREQAERLQDDLEKIPTLKNVEIHGLPDEIVRVELKLDKIAQMEIPLHTVIASLKSELLNIPAGNIVAGTKTFNVKTSGNLSSVSEIENTVVYSMHGQNVLLKDIADCRQTFEETTHITRLNGYRCVFVVAAQKNGENINSTQKVYQPVIERFRRQLPPNIDLVQHFEQADHVNRRLAGLGRDFLIAILLVAFTLLPLGLRAASLVMVSIPLSLSLGLFLLHLFGFNLNQLSIVGLVVALGLLVDDSIVVVENIERWLGQGYSKTEATIKATSQIGVAVIGCTATLVIAFMPLIFLPEGPGDFIRGMPAALMTSVVASMAVSLTIIPFLASRLLKKHSGDNLLLTWLRKAIHGTYSKVLTKALNYPRTALALAGLLFILSLPLFSVIGFTLFPPTEKPQFLINVTTPIQSNLETTDSVTARIEKILAATPEVEYFAVNVGKGNPRIYYNYFPENERADFSQAFVQLHEEVSPAEKQKLMARLRQVFDRYTGVRIEVRDFEQGPPKNAPVEVRLLGDNLDTLRLLSIKVEEMLKRTNGTMYVNNPLSNLKSDIRVSINKQKARAAGVHIEDIDNSVRLAIGGIGVGHYSDPRGDDFDIVLTSPKQERSTLASFNSVFVNNGNNKSIPIQQVADLRLEAAPQTIDHYNRVRSVSISAYVRSGYLNSAVIEQVITDLNRISLPSGYSYIMGGDVEAHEESLGGMGSVLIVTVFFFVAALVLMFKTFKSMLIVLSVIPLGIVGAVSALFLTDNPMSFVAVVGFIALIGIEVKNSILLVDFTNQLRSAGQNVDEAVKEAGEIRFLPIVLTSLTAIGGLLPIAFSVNPLISPLAIVLIGGLISSTLLSRIVTPVVYKLIPPAIN